jgi:hypothetical protein
MISLFCLFPTTAAAEVPLASEVNTQDLPFYVDGEGWLSDEVSNKSININYGDNYSAVLSIDGASVDSINNNADYVAFVCAEFYNGVWVPCFDSISYIASSWTYSNGAYIFPVSWSTITAGVTMVEFSAVFLKNANPYTLLHHSAIRYNILYDGVPALDVGVTPYDGSSQYMSLRFVDTIGGYCRYYLCTPLGGGSGGVVEAPGGGVVTQSGLMDWVSLLPINNIFSANVKAFIAPFVNRFITPLQFDVTPLLRMRDYMYFTGVVFSTLDPVLNMGLLAALFLLVFTLAFLYLFQAVWDTFRRLMW